MKITVVCVGKIKESYFTMGIEEYKKRLSKYCKLEIIEVLDEKTSEKASEAEELQIKQKEAERLKKYIKEGAYLIALAIQGKQLDSIQFAEKIQKIGIDGKSHIIFIIGGSLGLEDSILKQSDFLLSFSKMTFPHQMMRMILLEQVYRCYRIINGQPYHK